jgi:hypothetical protein
MRRALAILVILVICVGLLGLYMGWFRFSSSTTNGKTDVTLTVDKDQIKKDKDRAVEKVQGSSTGTEPSP